MDEDGSWLSHHHGLQTQPAPNEKAPTSGGLCQRSSFSPQPSHQREVPHHGVGLSAWSLTILVVLLCQIPTTATAASLQTACPGQCHCSNVTATAKHEEYYIIINCSRTNLQGLLDMAFRDRELRREIADGNNISLSDGEHLSGADEWSNRTDLFLEPALDEDRQQSVWRSTVANVHGNKSNTPIHGVSLDLSFNNISSLQAFMYNVSGWQEDIFVHKLNLSNNLIETLDNSMKMFANLVILDLSNNRIHTFSPLILHVPSLQYLFLHHNNIVAIQTPDARLSTLLPCLVYLDLSHNQLADLPSGAFSAFPALTSLNLTHNAITVVGHFAFKVLHRLKHLSLSHNSLHSLDYPVFQNTSLESLCLADMPNLSDLRHNVFKGLKQLQYLDLSGNSELDFLQPAILSGLSSLNVLDLSRTAIQEISPITFHSNLQLQAVYLLNMSLTCSCTNAWLANEAHKNDSIFQISSLQCIHEQENQTVSITDATFPCQQILIHNMTRETSIPMGSTLMLQCKEASLSGGGILTWTTPRGKIFHFHHFHPNASQHLLTPKDVQPNAPFHEGHVWHSSSSYYSDLSSSDERMFILTDGSLFIDYMLRSDGGLYTCQVKNAYFNSSGTVTVHFSYFISTEVKIIGCVVGLLSAVAIFTLNLIYVAISWLTRRLINKRRRAHIGQMLENLNGYKSTQITRIYENYTSQLSRVRNRYHAQRDRLHRNYTMQVDRVKRGCSHQVEKVRENYNSKLTHLRDYSSNQIVQIRDIANTQIGRIRDYGSCQLDRVRETYKLQHQHMMKLLDTLNLDNCRSIVETECMRTESMMYDLDLLSQDDDRTESPFSTVDSEYNTAASSPFMSVGRTDPNVEEGELNRDENDSEREENVNLRETNLRGSENEPCFSSDEETVHKSKNKNTIQRTSLPSVDLNAMQLPVTYPDVYMPWEGDFAKQEVSPTKIWVDTGDFFQYKDDEATSTVNMYDADIDDEEEEEEEEKIKESDTMV